VRLLLAWYDANGRDLPWRRTRDPYHILVSEVMLQQTPVSRVLPKYDEWLRRFPTARKLADADREEVETAWRPLGYNDRARRLHDIARCVVREGEMPRSLEGLLALDGVGQYTARAVMLFAYEKRVAVLDTNVARVLARVFGVGSHEGGPPRGADARSLWELAEAVLPRARVYDFTQALMDLGATVCLKRHARCDACPERAICVAFARRLPPTERAHERLDVAARSPKLPFTTEHAEDAVARGAARRAPGTARSHVMRGASQRTPSAHAARRATSVRPGAMPRAACAPARAASPRRPARRGSPRR
jgi:A/G-specific adenine glycosylase